MGISGHPVCMSVVRSVFVLDLTKCRMKMLSFALVPIGLIFHPEYTGDTTVNHAPHACELSQWLNDSLQGGPTKHVIRDSIAPPLHSREISILYLLLFSHDNHPPPPPINGARAPEVARCLRQHPVSAAPEHGRGSRWLYRRLYPNLPKFAARSACSCLALPLPYLIKGAGIMDS